MDDCLKTCGNVLAPKTRFILVRSCCSHERKMKPAFSLKQKRVRSKLTHNIIYITVLLSHIFNPEIFKDFCRLNVFIGTQNTHYIFWNVYCILHRQRWRKRRCCWMSLCHTVRTGEKRYSIIIPTPAVLLGSIRCGFP